MINIILGILIVNQIFHIILKPRNPLLMCGLWGFYGNINKFDINKFNILGINNQNRGGDAIGVVTPKTITHDVKEKTYTDFLTKNKITIPKTVNYVAGHVRKSSDNITRAYTEYAQPILKWNDDFTAIDYIFSHNGTLNKYIELFDRFLKDVGDKTFKYLDLNDGNIDINNINDSHVLFQALILKKYEVLNNYAGSAAFAFYNTKDNLLYLFSGKSKGSYASAAITTERPLYYAEMIDYLWYSSIDTGLKIITDGNSVKEVDPNTLLVFKNGRLQNRISVDRSKSGQSDTTTEWLKPKFDIHNLYNNRNNHIVDRVVKGFINNKNNSTNNTPFTINGENVTTGVTYVNFCRGRYVHEGNRMNGIYHITTNGKVESEASTSIEGIYVTKVYYFIDGIMINNHDSFNIVSRHIKNTPYWEDNSEIFDLLLKHSYYPIHNINDGTNEIFWKYSIKDKSAILFTGSLKPFFTYREYIFAAGKLVYRNNISNENRPIHEPPELKKIDTVTHLPVVLNKKTCELCNVTLVGNEHKYCTECWTFYPENNIEDDCPFDDTTAEKVDKELEKISTAMGELRMKLMGESEPYMKKVADTLDDVESIFIELTNWSWENNI